MPDFQKSISPLLTDVSSLQILVLFSFCPTILSVMIFLSVYLTLRGYVAGGVCSSKARMDGKTAIVTGANTGMGKATAMDLAKRGARVILACRNMKRGEAALKDIVEETGSTKVVLKHLDLSSLTSIREFAEDINKNERELHVLINNAGISILPELTKTEDGLEMMMGVNHLGHYLLTNLLIDLLKKSAPSRVVTLASSAHEIWTSDMNFDNINCETTYDKYDAYGQSKLANILFARELAKRLQGTGVISNSVHPGMVMTDLTRHFGLLVWLASPLISLIAKTPEQGAQTAIYLAVSEEAEGVSGLYFADCKPTKPAKYAEDDEAAKKLWEVSADLVGLDTTI